MIRIWCETCQKSTALYIEPLGCDDLNGDAIWGDIVCSECGLVIATLTADEPGNYDIVRMGH